MSATARGSRAGVLSAAILSIGLVVLSGAAAGASEWPDGEASPRDDVTGYLCVDPGCTTLRLPESNCLCQKLNPGEFNVRNLRLKCSVVSFGKVSACPVKSRYGINE
jgi:hypothetical protein